MGGPVLGRPRRSRRSGRPALGEAPGRLDAAAVRRRLAALGPDGDVAAALDRRVSDQLGSVVALSDLSSALTVDYVERVARPMGAMPAPAGARLVMRGYVAHMVVEEDPGAFGAADVPVLGNLPPLRNGRPPRDLLTRVVKATRRRFDIICALSPAAWEGLVAATAGHVHREAARTAAVAARPAGQGASPAGQGASPAGDAARRAGDAARPAGGQGRPAGHAGDDAPRYLAESLVDGLLRTGWVLRQVDLAYGQEPERRP